MGLGGEGLGEMGMGMGMEADAARIGFWGGKVEVGLYFTTRLRCFLKGTSGFGG